MLIIGDETRDYGKLPWVTLSLLFINIFVFCVQGAVGDSFTNGFALVPEEISTGRDLVGVQETEVKFRNPERYDRRGRALPKIASEWITIEHYPGPFPIQLTLFTSMFLHGDLIHLICNMWFLAIFGRGVEYALRPGRFLLYYVICGIAGGIAQVIIDPHSMIPCIGASGAISGVMGAYLAINPMQKVNIWLGFYWGVVQVPAVVVLGIWFMLQYMAAGAALDAGVNTGTAYMAHVGGFVAGLFLIWGTILYYHFKTANEPPVDETPEATAAREALDMERDKLEAAFRNFASPRIDDKPHDEQPPPELEHSITVQRDRNLL